MSTAPLYFEPSDPPDLPIIPIDRDIFERVVRENALAIDIDTAAGVQVVELDGLAFVAPLTEVTS